jgi:hypothetical protein
MDDRRSRGAHRRGDPDQAANGRDRHRRLVEVKGTEEASGTVLATTIEVKQGVLTPPPVGGDAGDFTGAIQSLPTGSLLGQWSIAGRAVQVVSTTRLDQERGGFAVGVTVEVHGTVSPGGIVTASVIEVKAGGTSVPPVAGNALEVMGTIEALAAIRTARFLACRRPQRDRECRHGAEQRTRRVRRRRDGSRVQMAKPPDARRRRASRRRPATGDAIAGNGSRGPRAS